jgi:hypothetical protein
MNEDNVLGGKRICGREVLMAVVIDLSMEGGQAEACFALYRLIGRWNASKPDIEC